MNLVLQYADPHSIDYILRQCASKGALCNLLAFEGKIGLQERTGVPS